MIVIDLLHSPGNCILSCNEISEKSNLNKKVDYKWMDEFIIEVYTNLK